VIGARPYHRNAGDAWNEVKYPIMPLANDPESVSGEKVKMLRNGTCTYDCASSDHKDILPLYI
jgi:hypothetical protein